MIKFLFRLVNKGHLSSTKKSDGTVDICMRDGNYVMEWNPIYACVLKPENVGRFIKLGEHDDKIVMMVDVPRSTNFETHCHSDAHEYIQVLSGKLYESHTMRTLVAGDSMFTAAGQHHSLHALDDSIYLTTYTLL